MTMNKNEYEASIKTNLTTAEALCADLRKLRGLKKLAETIPGAESIVSYETLGKTIEGKEAELKKVRAELQKARRIAKKLEEIEAIEAGDVSPKAKKPVTKKPVPKKDAAAKKPTSKKAEQPKAAEASESPAA